MTKSVLSLGCPIEKPQKIYLAKEEKNYFAKEEKYHFAKEEKNYYAKEKKKWVMERAQVSLENLRSSTPKKRIRRRKGRSWLILPLRRFVKGSSNFKLWLRTIALQK